MEKLKLQNLKRIFPKSKLNLIPEQNEGNKQISLKILQTLRKAHN